MSGEISFKGSNWKKGRRESLGWEAVDMRVRSKVVRGGECFKTEMERGEGKGKRA